MIFKVGGNAYTLAYEHKNGWNAEAFKERYSEVLDRYDYIVGDWGYNQLRLRGFYKEGHPRATKDTIITSLMDYLNEYCNFGCAYFVLAKTDAESVPQGTPDLTAGLETGASDAGESGKQTAETAAASASHNGILMRWPLKERSGGPVRMPGAAAVARAAAEAERRSQQTQAQNKTGDARGASAAPSGRQASSGGRKAGRQVGGGAVKPHAGSSAAGQAEHRGGGKAGHKNRGPRPPHTERQASDSRAAGQWRQLSEEGRSAELATAAAEPNPQRTEAAKNGSRFTGKNRRRPRFGGKQNREGGASCESDGTVQPGGE